MLEWIIEHVSLLIALYVIGMVLDVIGRMWASQFDVGDGGYDASSFLWPIFWAVAIVKGIYRSIVGPIWQRLKE